VPCTHCLTFSLSSTSTIMVPNNETNDIYSPFRLQVMIHDEVTPSSEERSGVYSPTSNVFPQMLQMPSIHGGHESCMLFFFVVYVSVFFKPKVLKVRYQHVPPDNLSPTPELLVPKFDSAQGLNKNQRQQIPTTDSALEPPSSNARQVTLSHCNQLYSSRYHLGHFPTQYPHVSSLVHATSRDAPVRFIPSLYERPFPCGSALDLISSNSSNMDGDHRLNPMGTTGPEEPSITNVTNPSRENRKRTVPVVIACRLWQVSH